MLKRNHNCPFYLFSAQDVNSVKLRRHILCLLLSDFILAVMPTQLVHVWAV